MRLSNDHGGDLCARTRQYALRVIRLYSELPPAKPAQIMGMQVLRSGTSIGAHLARVGPGEVAGGLRQHGGWGFEGSKRIPLLDEPAG